MGRCTALFLALSILFILAGCLPKSELKKTSIVQAIGIDIGENEAFAVTLQTYNPKSAGSGASIDTSENNAGVIMGEGETVSAAIHNAVISGGKELFTGYNRLIILGRTLAEQGIESIFSYFDRNTATRQNVGVLVADGDAREIVSTDIKEGILAAEMIEKMLEDRVQNGYISNMPYYKLSKNMYLYEGAAVLPLIEPAKEEKEQKNRIPNLQKVNATRSAVFANYKLVAELDQRKTRGSVLLHDELRETVLVAKNKQGGPASIQIYECRTKLIPKFSEDQVSFVAKVEAVGTLDEVLTHGEVNADSDFSAWEEDAANLLEEEMQASFQSMVVVAGADVLYLEELICNADEEIWKGLEQSEGLWLKKLTLEPDVTVTINRIGMQTNRELPNGQ